MSGERGGWGSGGACMGTLEMNCFSYDLFYVASKAAADHNGIEAR